MDDKTNDFLDNGDIMIARQPVPDNDYTAYLRELEAEKNRKAAENTVNLIDAYDDTPDFSKGTHEKSKKKSKNSDGSTRAILIAILVVGICLLAVSVFGMIAVSMNVTDSAQSQGSENENNDLNNLNNNQNPNNSVVAPVPDSTAPNQNDNNENNQSQEEQPNQPQGEQNNSNPAAPSNDAQWLEFFNTAVNKMKTDGPSMVKAKRTQTADIQLSNPLGQTYVSVAKDKYLSDETVKTNIAKGDVAAAKTVVSPDGESYVSMLTLNDIKSISSKTEANGNYVIRIDMPDATNPDLQSSYAKIFEFMLVDDVMDTYAPNMGATVDRSNVFLNYTGCYAEAVISPEGKVVSYYTKVNANMILKDAKVKIVTTDLDVTLFSDTEYTDINW